MSRQVDYPYFARCEPALTDLLSDPILQMLLTTDGVRRQDLQSLIDKVSTTIAAPERETLDLI